MINDLCMLYCCRYMRKVFDYCSAMTPVALTSSDFEVLGHLVCDIPASIIDQFGVPLEVLWMFHDCWFNEEQGDALFKTLTLVHERRK